MALQMGFTGVVIAEKLSDNLAISDNPTYKLVGAHDVFNCQQESPSSSSERRWVPLPRADSERLEAILAHAAGKEPIIWVMTIRSELHIDRVVGLQPLIWEMVG